MPRIIALITALKTLALNLGTGGSYSILEIVSTLQLVTGRPVPVVHASGSSGGPSDPRGQCFMSAADSRVSASGGGRLIQLGAGCPAARANLRRSWSVGIELLGEGEDAKNAAATRRVRQTCKNGPSGA